MMNKRIRLIQSSHQIIKRVLKEWSNILLIEWFCNIQIFSKLYINNRFMILFVKNHHFDIHICVSYLLFYIDIYLNLNLYIMVNFNMSFRRFVVIAYVCHNLMIFTLFCIAHHIESNHILNLDFWVYWSSSTLS